jgi:dsDNA-specific endonuclease/ATPase MutS2
VCDSDWDKGENEEPLRIPITDVFDLHSVAPRDVKEVVREYLLEAHRQGFTALRIIHGRGIGVQREIVRSVLAQLPFVVSFADAPAEAGGWGATLVTLTAPERPTSKE